METERNNTAPRRPRRPLNVERLSEGQGIRLEWPGDLIQNLSSETLRRNCQSADSRAERGDFSHDQPLPTGKKTSKLRVVEHSRKEQLKLVRLWPIGNYAIGLEWADGHRTGIYSYDLLYKLGGLTRRNS